MAGRLDAIEHSSPENAVKEIKIWIEEVKPIDEYFANEVMETRTDLDNRIEKARKEGKLAELIFRLENAIAPNFDYYSILTDPIEIGIERYLEYVPTIKKLNNAARELIKNVSDRDKFFITRLYADIEYFAEKLKEGINKDNSAREKKEEWLRKIEEAMKE